MTASWSLPGYDVEALLGTGATAEVWRGRERATGRPVALKRLRVDADPDALRREAEVLRSLDTPYVVRLRDVVGDGAQTVLVLDLAGGGSLAALLRRRGTLDPGEVVTVVAPVAQALAVAHAAGLVHGDVSPSNVLLTETGMPLLADLGTARSALEPAGEVVATAEYLDPAVACGGRPTDASDVWSLAALCHHLLAGSPPHEGAAVHDVLRAARGGGRAPLGLLAPAAPRALVDAVEAALVRDPALRPDAAGFAASLRQAQAAEPVRFDGPAAAAALPDVRPTHAVPRHAAPAVEPVAAHRRRLPSWLVPVAVGAVLLAVAAGVGWAWGRSGDAAHVAVPAVSPAAPPAAAASPAASPSSAAARAPVPQDWAALVDGLDAARAEAFATADAARLEDVYAPQAPGLATDRDLVGQLAAAGQTASGVRHEVRDVQVLEVGDDRARLRVVDVLSAYELRGVDGAVVARTPARGEAAFLVELQRTSAGWRLAAVVPES